jgi:hypothetical protein
MCLDEISIYSTFQSILQLNKYETDPYFRQIFQSSTSVCLIICVFSKSCEPICEPEIVLKIQTRQWGDSNVYLLVLSKAKR